MTETASHGTLYVPTDLGGRQLYAEKETLWPLPTSQPAGAATPGEVVTAPATDPFALFSLDRLLEELNDRIFVAEVMPETAVEAHPWGVSADAARLVAETPWSTLAAARFALDCAEHVLELPKADAVRLTSGESLADVIQAARKRLGGAETEDSGLLGRVSQIALARRLQRSSDKVAAVAFGRTVVDRVDGVDILDDPAWEAIAATRDAVLAAVEAVRHQAFPQLVERDSARYEENVVTGSPESESESVPIVTPWGNFVGGPRGGVVPASVAARDAAERARQAAGDAGGPDVAEAERAWQRRRLAAAIA